MEFPCKHFSPKRRRVEMQVKDCYIKLSKYKLPNEILYDIFCRLPVKSLLRFRCISRIWQNVIDSVDFADMHISIQVATAGANAEEPQPQLLSMTYTNEGKIVHSYIYDGKAIKESERPILEFSFSEEYPHCIITHTAYGLLLFRNVYDVNNLFICNPLRGELLELPRLTGMVDPRTCFILYGIGFDCTTNCYKIVQHRFWKVYTEIKSPSSSDIRQETHIYTLGKNSWRQLSSPAYFKPTNVHGVYAYGDVHWAWKNWDNGNKIKAIKSFDFKTEEFKDTPLPDFGCQCELYEKVELIDLKGFLAVVSFPTHDHIDIWMLKNYMKKEWVREYRTSTQVWARGLGNNGAIARRDIDFWKHEINVYACGRGLVIDFQTQKLLLVLDLDTNLIWCMQRAKSYRSSPRNFSYTASVLTLRNFGNPIANIFPRYKFLKNASNFYVSPIDDIMDMD